MDTICDRLLITIQTYPFLFLIPITSAMNYLSNIMFGGVQSGSIGGDSIIIRSNKTTAQFSTKIGNLERLSRAEEIRWESFFSIITSIVSPSLSCDWQATLIVGRHQPLATNFSFNLLACCKFPEYEPCQLKKEKAFRKGSSFFRVQLNPSLQRLDFLRSILV